MDTLHKTLAGAALAGLLVTGGASAPAFAGDNKDDDKGSYSHDKDHDKDHGKDHGKDKDRDDETKNGEVDVKVKYRHHGKWKVKEYEDVSLKKAASIAKDKADGGKWDKYYRDAKYTDKTDKTVKTVDKKWVKVYFEQDEDKDYGHGHDKDKDKGHDKGKGYDKDKDKDKGKGYDKGSKS